MTGWTWLRGGAREGSGRSARSSTPLSLFSLDRDVAADMARVFSSDRRSAPSSARWILTARRRALVADVDCTAMIIDLVCFQMTATRADQAFDA